MPFIVMKRSDIPAGTLQVLDLDPNESQRNLIYDPPGQTKYVDAVQNDTVVLTGAGPIITVGALSGLAAWFVTNIDDGGGAALTAGEANTDAADVLGLLEFGSLTAAAGVLTLAAINGALTTGTISAGQVGEVLDILAGRAYTVPAGVQVDSNGTTFLVAPAVGAVGGPAFGPERQVLNTSSLLLSVNTGALLGYLRSDFTYLGAGGTNGEAVVVYNDDGTLF